MLNLFKPKAWFQRRQEAAAPWRVDIHSHLIPGIDDGVQTMEESLRLIRRLRAMGYRKLITTPHTMQHRYANTKERILSGLDMLREALSGEGIEIEIEAASEYYLDAHFMELVQRKEVLTFGQDYLLFELSYLNAPLNLEQTVFEMLMHGYRPVLAHPERYLYLSGSMQRLDQLKKMGLYLQVDINSIEGYYSSAVKAFAQRIAKEGWIDFLGSDTHHLQHIESLERLLASGQLEGMLQNNTILNDTL